MKNYPAPGTAEFSDFLVGILAEGRGLAPKGASDSELHLGLTILELEASVADAEIKNGCYGKGWVK